jgi:hypothetical protein
MEFIFFGSIWLYHPARAGTGFIVVPPTTQDSFVVKKKMPR